MLQIALTLIMIIIVQNNQMDSYFSVQQANALLNSKYSNEDSFSTICVNVRSLMNPHNFSKFESFISGLDFQPHLIAVNETWEKPHTISQHKNLNEYGYISNPRVVSRGGGDGMYIKQNLIFAPVLNYRSCMKNPWNLCLSLCNLKAEG